MSVSNSTKIAVIGAGISGISAANELIKQGLTNVTIFEALGRIGGRIHTEYVNPEDGSLPYRIEMGANWIHGTRGNPIFELAKNHSLLQQPKEWPKFARYDTLSLTVDGDTIPSNLFKQVATWYRGMMSKIDAVFVTLSKEKAGPEDCSIESEIRAAFPEFLQQIPMKQHELCEAILNHKLAFETTLCGCDSMTEVSRNQSGSYETLSGPDPDIPTGFIRVVKSLAEIIPEEQIKLNAQVLQIDYSKALSSCIGKAIGCSDTEVNSKRVVKGTESTSLTQSNGKANSKKIDSTGDKMLTAKSNSNKVSVKSEDKVVITLEDGTKEEFDHVIVTSSLNFLKKHHEKLFQPPLPDKKQEALGKMAMGTVDKVFLQFPHLNFLPSSCRYARFVWPVEETNLNHWTSRLHGFAVQNTPDEDMLQGWLTGTGADEMEQLSDDEVIDGCMDVLCRLFQNPDIPRPIHVIRTRWGSEPSILGAYSFIPVNGTVQDIQQLAEPITNKAGQPVIQFAGEATHPSFYSTTHGALLAGQREANIILQYYKQNKD